MIETIAFLIFSIASAYPNLAPYRQLFKGKNWWTKAWSFHAVTIASLTLILRLLNIDVAVLNVLSGVLMIISGFGLIILFLIYLLENKKSLFPPVIIVPHHFLMGLIGIWFMLTAKIKFPELVFIYSVLILYAVMIFPKGFDVPFILYQKSRLSIKTRRRVLQLFTAILFFALPLVAFGG